MPEAEEMTADSLRFRCDSVRRALFEAGKKVDRSHSWLFMMLGASAIVIYLSDTDSSAAPSVFDTHRWRLAEALLLITAFQYYRFATFAVYEDCLLLRLRQLLEISEDPHNPWYVGYPSFYFVHNEIVGAISLFWCKLVHVPGISMVAGLLMPLAGLIYIGKQTGFSLEWYFVFAVLVYIELAAITAFSSARTTRTLKQIKTDFGGKRSCSRG